MLDPPLVKRLIFIILKRTCMRVGQIFSAALGPVQERLTDTIGFIVNYRPPERLAPEKVELQRCREKPELDPVFPRLVRHLILYQTLVVEKHDGALVRRGHRC